MFNRKKFSKKPVRDDKTLLFFPTIGFKKGEKIQNIPNICKARYDRYRRTRMKCDQCYGSSNSKTAKILYDLHDTSEKRINDTLQ